jgi:LacI family transcriptional regulator
MMPNAGQQSLASDGSERLPMVLIGSHGAADGKPSFIIDNFCGAFAITEHLFSSGRSRVAFVAGPVDNLEAGERLRGYRAAVERLAAAERIVEGDFSEESGRRAAEELIRAQRPEAIFCANDMMAVGCLEALRDAGIAVPHDIALAGFDDIPIARYVNPPLTTAAVPIAEIGRQALECCAQAIAGAEDNQQRTFKPQLVIRASSEPRFRGAHETGLGEISS